jgi:hypothetical protein
MKVTHEQTKTLLEGSHAFTQLGFSMMLTRLKTLYTKNPSQTALQTCTEEVNAFLSKFKMIMGDDYEFIINL